MALARMTDQIGRVLAGRYRLLAPIGAGASAQVFLAEDTRLRRRVAIKLLHESFAGDAAFIRRFRAEAQVAAGLNHPNVVAVYDWGEDEVPFLVTEFVSGGSLRAMLDQGRRLSIAQACDVGIQAAKGLDHAHRQGLVHRDLKPANLLFGDDERLRIADFGLARALADAAVTEPSGAVVGTARYASPEQAQGRPLTGASDVYALALVLIESVTGHVPFSVDSMLGTLMARVSEPIPVSSRLEVLAPVLERAGAVDPRDRPDAATLAGLLIRASEALDRPEPLPLAGALVLPDGPVDVGRDPTLLPGPGAGPAEPSEAAAVAPAEPSRRDERRARKEARRAARGDRRPSARRRLVVAALVGLGVALLVVGGVLATGVWRPTHEVPEVAGQPIGRVDALVGDLGFDVTYVGVRQNGTVAGQVLAQDPAAGAELREGEPLVLEVSRGPELVSVPVDALTGRPVAEATAALRQAGFVPGAVSEKYNELVVAGTVQAVPLPFDEVPRGSAVDLVVSLGPRPRVVPADAVGRPFDEVAAELEGLSLVVQRVEDPTLDVPEGTVTAVEPGPGSEVPRDSTVVVSVAVALVEVPDVTGLNAVRAAEVLEDEGFTVSQVIGSPARRVVSTDPAPGDLVAPGTAITLTTA